MINRAIQKGANWHNKLFVLIFLEKTNKMNIALKSSLEAAVLGQIVTDHRIL